MSANTGAPKQALVGWAVFPVVAFDQATFIVRARGFARTRIPWKDHEARPQAELTPESVFAGEALDEVGRPAENVHLTLISASSEQMNALADPITGRFVFSEMPAGTYTLLINNEASGRRSEEQLTPEPGKTLVKDIRLSATWAGRARPKSISSRP